MKTRYTSSTSSDLAPMGPSTKPCQRVGARKAKRASFSLSRVEGMSSYAPSLSLFLSAGVLSSMSICPSQPSILAAGSFSKSVGLYDIDSGCSPQQIIDTSGSGVSCVRSPLHFLCVLWES